MIEEIFINGVMVFYTDGGMGGKKGGRPRGLDKNKYFTVLQRLRPPICFNELVAACRGEASRGTVARVLADLREKGLVSVAYEGRKVYYELNSYGSLLTSPETFYAWLHLGMPRLDAWSWGEAKAILNGLGAVFMLDRYPYHAINLSRREYDEVFDHLKVDKARMEGWVKVHELYRMLAEHIQGLSGEIDRRLKAGVEISEINNFISRHGLWLYEEAKALTYINYLLVANKLCRSCFERGEIAELVDEFCTNHKGVAELASEVHAEFREWARSALPSRKRIYVNGLIIEF
jgi:DNA-binding transcriptional ArsR family regulator